MTSPLGIWLALGALFFWSLTPFFFAATGRIIGPFATNFLRLGIAAPAMLLASAAGWALAGGDGFPRAGVSLLLIVSGVLGLGLGDLFLYRSLFRVGPERSSLLMTLAPAAAAALGWFALGEALSASQLAGMTLILGGVLATVWNPSGRRSAAGGAGIAGLSFWSGASAGLLAALCQAAGSVMARQAFLAQPDLSPLFATTLRIAAAAAAMAAVARWRGDWKRALEGARKPRVLPRILLGTLCGPILGMTCYIAAMKHQPAGIVTTITFMTPLLVMPLGAWHYGTRVGPRLVFSVLAALAGVVLLGLNPG
jgi:drug/metabolite transporter (DMT)-like permease